MLLHILFERVYTRTPSNGVSESIITVIFQCFANVLDCISRVINLNVTAPPGASARILVARS